MMSSILLRATRTAAIVAAFSSVATAQVFGATTPAPATNATAAPPGTLAPINKSTPEFDAFRKVWDGISNYSETIVAHETTNDGKSVQDRTYHYLFVKPNAALIVITGGPGRGGGAAWHGGSTVHGHKGGILSAIKLTLAKDDPRVTSLRGDQIEVASYGNQLDRYSTVPGTLSEAKVPLGTEVIFVPTKPDRSGITKEVLTISPASHLPVKHEAFVGERSVKLETFSDVKLNAPGLKAENVDI